MAEDTTRTSNRKLNSGASEYNALSFAMEQMIKNSINTAIPVKVESCTKPGVGGAAGYVSATPLVMQRGADGQGIPPVALPQLPFFRLQCGEAAIIMDPQPGDIGLAIFAQQDTSNVGEGTDSPVQAGSFRSFDMSDGFYIGGFFGKTPKVYCAFDPEKQTIIIKTPKDTVSLDEEGNVTVTATAKVTLEAPTVEIKGNLEVNGTITTSGTVTAPHFEQGSL